MTTLTALARTTPILHPGPRFGRGALIGFSATLAAGVALVSAASIAVAVMASGRIMPGVHVAGVDVGGMEPAAAEAHLREELPSLAAGELMLSVDGTEVPVSYADLGRGYRLDAMLASAYEVARSGNLLDDALARLRVLAQSRNVAPLAASEDTGVLQRTVASLVSQFSRDPVNAAVTTEGVGFSVVPGVDGATLDAAELEAAFVAAANSTTGDAGSISISTIALPAEITTAEATRAVTEATRMVATPLSLRGDGEARALDEASLAALLSFEETGEETIVPVIDQEGLTALIEALAPEVARRPSDADFEWGPAGITGVLPAVEGLELDVAGSVASVLEALEARSRAVVRRSAPLSLVAVAPALTTEAAQAAAAKMVRLPGGSWTTYYTPGEGNYFNANIHIPAWDLDTLVLAPGEWFSFWNDIGPVTTARGYGYGGVILGGRSVANGALAGGICSTSTTLFNAAMRAGLQIGDRANHSYYIERYPMGLDATVLKTDSWAQDMTFRNDTANPIVIRSYTGDGWVRFDIWGVPDGRTVSLTRPVTSNHGKAKETTVVNNSLAPGTSKRVEYPHDGFDAVVTRTVRNASGGVIWSNTWTSHYRTVNGVTEVGPTPASTPAPATPSASPSPSAEPVSAN